MAAAARKAQLFGATRAVAVDMESAAVAEVAAQHGLPFLVLRVVLDTAADSLPASIAARVDPAAARSGRSRAWLLLVALLPGRPIWQRCCGWPGVPARAAHAARLRALRGSDAPARPAGRVLMRALVTGASGFVGAAVARALLAAGARVRALLREQSESPQSRGPGGRAGDR